MSSKHSSRVAPSVAALFCVAGCGSTGSNYAERPGMIGPPQFNRASASTGLSREELVKLAQPQREMPSRRKNAAAPTKTPKSVVLTQFEAVPEEFLETAQANPSPQPPSFFEPLPPADIPAIVAESVISEGPRYVSVGPEYFGDSEIAPYVISVSEIPPAAQAFTVANAPVATPLPRSIDRDAAATTQSRRIVSRSGKYSVVTELVPPLSPDQQLPPGPREMPPMLPSRAVSVLNAPKPDSDPLLDAQEFVEGSEQKPTPPRIKVPAGLSSPERSSRQAPAVPEIPGLKAEKPRVRGDQVSSLNAPRMMQPRQSAIPDLPIMSAPESPKMPTLTKPDERDTAIAEPIVTKTPAPKPEMPGGCFVNRGSNDRMILICDGADVTQSQVFRAVVEGESAFRGLRDFDQVDRILEAYGFNTTRYTAMTQGPQTAKDLAFLRQLRASGSGIRVKGRPFDLYLLKGDKGVATVLVERAAAPERASIRTRH